MLMRKSVVIAACLCAITQVASATIVVTVVQASASLTALVPTTNSFAGKQAGSPHTFAVPSYKTITLNTQNIVNLAQGLAYTAPPVPGVTLGYACASAGAGTYVVVKKTATTKAVYPLPTTATLAATPYIPVGTRDFGLTYPAVNAITSPPVQQADWYGSSTMITPAGAPNSLTSAAQYSGLGAMTSPFLGVATTPVTANPLSFSYLNHYIDYKQPDIAKDCFSNVSGVDSHIEGVIPAKLDATNVVLLVIIDGKFSYGNTLLGYH